MPGKIGRYQKNKIYGLILIAAATIFLTASFLFMDERQNAAEEGGGVMSMTGQTETLKKDIPLLDQNTPSVIETATFALG